MELKKAYYYIISLIALFVLFWGTVDFANTVIGSFNKAPALQADQGMMQDGMADQSLDSYYQKKMLFDRYSDSLVRIVISGLVFLYSKKQLKNLENA